MTTHTDRIRQMAQEAGFDIENGEITAPHALIDGDPMDVSEQIARFAQLVAEDCARVADGLASFDWESAASAHRIDQAIRARYSPKD